MSTHQLQSTTTRTTLSLRTSLAATSHPYCMYITVVVCAAYVPSRHWGVGVFHGMDRGARVHSYVKYVDIHVRCAIVRMHHLASSNDREADMFEIHLCVCAPVRVRVPCSVYPLCVCCVLWAWLCLFAWTHELVHVLTY